MSLKKLWNSELEKERVINDDRIEEFDERLTSSLAKRYIPRGQSIDIESARILLEEWFNKRLSV